MNFCLSPKSVATALLVCLFVAGCLAPAEICAQATTTDATETVETKSEETNNKETEGEKNGAVTAALQDATGEGDPEALDEEVQFENRESPENDEVQTIEISENWKRLGKNQIWINHTDKQVMVRGRICLRDGPLEMFACPGTSKAHESIVAAEAKSSEVHACFVALGFDPGNPVQWDPQYIAATGPSVSVSVKWKAGASLKEADAQTMVRVSGTEKTMDTGWVFGGSQEFTDNVTGEKIYYADSGEMICLSNFSTAMMDVPIKSSDAADGLLFEANTKNIPPVNTKVYLVLTPKKANEKANEKE